MLRIPGPTCGIRLGEGWVDSGTSAITRMPTPPAQPRRPAAALTLSPVEQQLLIALDFAGIGNINERAMFLAQVRVESGGFKRMRENLHYSPARLRTIFGKYVKSEADAEELVREGPDAIANRVYGPTHKGLGNDEPGDGARYIGRGYIQLTGKDNYRSAGRALGLDLVEHPELVEEPAIASRTAVWFWLARVSRTAAQIGDVRNVTLNVNSGLNGLKERRTFFRHYQSLLKSIEAVHELELRLGPPPGPTPYLLLP